MERSLEKVFNPRSIAVIGASEVPGKASTRRTKSLLEGGYKGEVYLVNPKRSEILGQKAYSSITEIGKEIDLVMIIVAPRFLVSSVVDSVRAGAKGVIIITAGLGETGDTGKDIESEMVRETKKTETYLIGPNCSGMFSAAAHMNLLGLPHIEAGGISILAQSGNVIDSLTHYGGTRGLGFSKIISLGNAVGVSLSECVDYLRNDSSTKVIVAYLEGIRDGNRFIRVARETIRKKPIIALKVGRSLAGARAAASHTGSLTGDNKIVDAAFRQAGVVKVTNVDEMIDVAETFLHCPLPSGNRVAILSEGGGDNAIAADNAENYGVEVPVLSKETQDKLRSFLLQGMPASNPIDYGGTAEENPNMITECARVCMESDQIDGLYITGFFGGFRDIIAPHIAELEEQTSRDLVGMVARYGKPLFVHTSFAGGSVQSLNILRDAGIPVMESGERSMRCLSELMRFAKRQCSCPKHFAKAFPSRD